MTPGGSTRRFDVDVAAPGTAPPPDPPDPPGDAARTPTAQTPSAPGAAAPRRRAVRFSDVAVLPRFGRCVDRRRGVRITVRDAATADVRSVRVLVNGRVVRGRSAVGRRAVLTVRPLPAGRPLVKVIVTLAGGKRLSRTTRYRVCRR